MNPALKVKRIGVIVKPNQPQAWPVVDQMCYWLNERGVEMFVERSIGRLVNCPNLVEREEMPDIVDVIVTLGGDGTIIAVARLIADRQVPVLGINFGSLGYLAEFTMNEIFDALESVLTGQYVMNSRMMLDATTIRQGEPISRATVLNDAVVNKSALARIIQIDCWIDEQFVTSFRADGLIVSTPTGSTAYNLSAGGPILHPSSEAIVISPICPHTLSMRPLVVPDDAIIELILRAEHEEVMLTLDGQSGHRLYNGDRIRIEKSQNTFRLITPPNRNYYQVLRDKLRWGTGTTEK